MKYIRLLFFFLFVGISLSFAKADVSGFINQLKAINIPINQILSQTGISRYEISRLLNAVECKDCINPDTTYTKAYTAAFWRSFGVLPGKYFEDIFFRKAPFQSKDYFYCVAYVGDNNEMNGYPSATSPLCAGKFCGERFMTKAEFLQVIMNIIGKYLYPLYTAPWKDMDTRMDSLSHLGYKWKTFTDTERTLISQKAKTCTAQSCSLKSSAELSTYLKYCMFNLNACGMIPFGKIKEGYWPVAELNLLYKQNLIDLTEASTYNIGELIDGRLAINVLAKLNTIIGCSFNNDYDCDGVDNSNDSCPNHYNPHQRDTDNDGIGNVCDDDIDGDGVKNPVGIVDDYDTIDIRLWTGSMDNCLFIQNPKQEHLSTSRIGNACFSGTQQLSLTIGIDSLSLSSTRFNALVKGPYRSLRWDFGDGFTGTGGSISHTYLEPGLYHVRLFAEGSGSNDAYADTTVVIGHNEQEQQGLSLIAPNSTFLVNQKVSFLVSAVGGPDTYIWKFGDGTIHTTSNGTLQKVFRVSGQYPLSVSSFKNNQLLSMTTMEVGIGVDSYTTFLRSSSLSPLVGNPVTFSTNIQGISSESIERIEWNFGDTTSFVGSSLSLEHTYTSPGKKVIYQTIYLTSGRTILNLLTLYVTSPHLFDSFGIQIIPSSLSLNPYISFDLVTSLVGIHPKQALFLGQWYGDDQHAFSLSPSTLPFSTKHKYIQGDLYTPSTLLSLDACTQLGAKATISLPNQGDFCLQLLLTQTLSEYPDMDKDSIPDVCDSDLDGDGVPNLLGIILPDSAKKANYANSSFLNTDILKYHYQGVCSLDNNPFVYNPEQNQINGDTGATNNNTNTPTDVDTFKNSDADGDGIVDILDSCPTIAETYNGILDYDGCPEIGTDLGCSTSRFSPFFPALSAAALQGFFGDGGRTTTDTRIPFTNEINSLAPVVVQASGTSLQDLLSLLAQTLLSGNSKDQGDTGVSHNLTHDFSLSLKDTLSLRSGGQGSSLTTGTSKYTLQNILTFLNKTALSGKKLSDDQISRILSLSLQDILFLLSSQSQLSGSGNTNQGSGSLTKILLLPLKDIIRLLSESLLSGGLDTLGLSVQEILDDSLSGTTPTTPTLSLDSSLPLIFAQTCQQCPCPFSDIANNLTEADEIKAVLWDARKYLPRAYSDAYEIVIQ